MMRGSNTHAIIVADLGFGDCGKGTTVDYLVRKHHAHTVVRYNGGPQAAHNVMTDDGRQHTFAQFGSGTFVPGTKTHLSRFMVVDPLRLSSENEHLRLMGIDDAFERLTIESTAPIVTPFQRAANRLREIARAEGRHGSCGIGVGETVIDARNGLAFSAGDLRNNHGRLSEKLRVLQIAKRAALAEIIAETRHLKEAQPEIALLESPQVVNELLERYECIARKLRIVPSRHLARVLRTEGFVIFEGAQGVLLDEQHGFHPHVTWSATTTKNADALLDDTQFSGQITRLGVIRGYTTRHGHGPFVSESAELSELLPDMHNAPNEWQGKFRVGWLDLVALRYALNAAGNIDSLAVTCLDRLATIGEWKACTAYRTPKDVNGRLLSHVHVGGSATITGINVVEKPTSARKTELAQLLRQCTMSCEDLESEVGLLRRIEEVAGIPISIVSKGPTASGKEIREPMAVK